MAHHQTTILGLVGGVGCGKSSVAAWLRDTLGAHVVDADAVGHAVLLQDGIRRQLAEAFGETILRDGQVDRRAVASRVFGDSPAHVAARKTLESIVHPVMRAEFEAAFREARQAPEVHLVVFDAAILLESGWRDAVDIVAFVDVPWAERLRRVALSRDWTEEDLRRREASQWPLDRKRAAADVVIDNSGSVDTAGRQLADYLEAHGHLTAGTPFRVTPDAGQADSIQRIPTATSNVSR